MNPQNTTDNNSDNKKEPLFDTKGQSQQCMNGSVAKSYNPFFGDEYLPKGHITTHPFSLTLKELSGQLNLGQENHQNSQTIQLKLDKDYSGSTDYSVEKFQPKPAEDTECLNESKIPGQLNSKKYKTLQTTLNQESSGSTDYSVELFPSKPLGGSGWLHKYTQLKETKTGLVEYPRVKEGQRSPDNPKDWYWKYCWHKKGKNGKPLYKKGKAVVESIGCPQKKVGAVEQAIAAKLPHRQILEIIKGDNSPPPPT